MNNYVPFAEVTDLDLVASLGSTDCCPACGGPKQRKHTFCRADYFKLPKSMRDALYNPLGHGYREAVFAAIERLGRTTFQAFPDE